MLRAFFPHSTPGYQPLPRRPADTQAGSRGTLVHEAQLSCSYVSPGGKRLQGGGRTRKILLIFTLNQLMMPRMGPPMP